MRLALGVALVLLGASSARAAPAPARVSIIQLIASPTSFDGAAVAVDGFLASDRAGARLFLHREDFERGLIANAVTLSGEVEPALSGRYVHLVGTVHAPAGVPAAIEVQRLEPSGFDEGLPSGRRPKRWTLLFVIAGLCALVLLLAVTVGRKARLESTRGR